ncbi:serine O-acetyltransferase EpsC [Edaphosphingomonas haloaromaticamans]|uniref:serine O-acetyltransferase n=1 Tax=Edaphosphingomonas haloaromaticamans TaxID=653954 RepID=A0A1S1H9I9_9SPHN|nr:serine O-acetyltransferase EpsC [Sphingomonas haloaromaticamans]OHT18794.1 Serine acetyltransferase [Sphingomonas haloaromaticamans]
MTQTAIEPFDPSRELGPIIAGLRAQRLRWRAAHERHAEHGGHGFPQRQAISRILAPLSALLFPLRLGPPELNPANEDAFIEATLETTLLQLAAQVRLELRYHQRDAADDAIEARVQAILRGFATALPGLRALLDSDVQAAWQGDPAARSVDEVLICYPSITAVIHYRLAHRLHELGAPLVARIITEIAHSRTGIDIHPGARIGARFFIDHGTGVVIGETAVIGEGVRLYQGVTLGAIGLLIDATGAARGEPRHPIVEDEVVIHAGATILGRVTIGRGAVIGGHVWLTRDVPPGAEVLPAAPELAIVE